MFDSFRLSGRNFVCKVLRRLISALEGDTLEPPVVMQLTKLPDWDLIPFDFRVDWYQEITLTAADSPRPFYEDSQSSSKVVLRKGIDHHGDFDLQ